MAPLVSVIIPTFNRAYCLTAALDSALGQSYSGVEVVLVDDGSTDGTEDLVRTRYREEFKNGRLVYVRQNNAGAAAARNHGLKLARGEFIAFLDSDDVWESWKIELQLDVLSYFPESGWVWTDMASVDADGKEQYPSMLRKVLEAYRWFPTNESLFDRQAPIETVSARQGGKFRGRKVYEGNLFSAMLMGCLFLPSSTLVRRNVIERVGTFRENLRLGEDYDYLLRICRESRGAYADVSSTRYQRGRADQLTHPGLHGEMLESLMELIFPILKYDRDRIRLSPMMLKARQAELHRDLGESLLDRGQHLRALKHLVISLRYQPLETRNLGLLSMAMLPNPVTNQIRRVYRRVRKRA